MTQPLPRYERPWGSYEVLFSSPDYWTKILYVNPGEALSLQYHAYRHEVWTPLDEGLTAKINGSESIDLVPGVRYDVPNNVLHRIYNRSSKVVALVEVAFGFPDETDIVRVNDKYGR